MKIDKSMITLFASPVIAIGVCIAIYVLVPQRTDFEIEQPEFLNYVDQLSLYSSHIDETRPDPYIKDVFHKHALETEPVVVSLIVKSPNRSYSIINGKKMAVGDRSCSFRLSAIHKDSITITYANGSKETFHVKPY